MANPKLSTLLALAMLVFSLPSFGQVATGTGSGGASGPRVEITLQGAVTSSLEIWVTGSTNLLNGTPTVVTGAGTSGVVNFGVYNLAGPLLTGEKHRVNSPPRGNYLVATLTTGVRFSGGITRASVDIQRTNPVGGPLDVPFANLLYAFQFIKNKGGKLSWPNWRNWPELRFGTSVFTVPASTYVPGPGNLDNNMVNGDFFDHQVGIWIPDSSPPGPFSTNVTYTATAF
ncbi:MAG: hypothetical protein ACKVPX_13560 [Myxococcaceae bacterium]